VGRDQHAFAPQPVPLTVLLVDTNIWLEAADQRERLDLVEIATMNGRDFYTVRPKHTTAFTLLPENISRY
jgi:hypothetical protein